MNWSLRCFLLFVFDLSVCSSGVKCAQLVASSSVSIHCLNLLRSNCWSLLHMKHGANRHFKPLAEFNNATDVISVSQCERTYLFVYKLSSPILLLTFNQLCSTYFKSFSSVAHYDTLFFGNIWHFLVPICNFHFVQGQKQIGMLEVCSHADSTIRLYQTILL